MTQRKLNLTKKLAATAVVAARTAPGAPVHRPARAVARRLTAVRGAGIAANGNGLHGTTPFPKSRRAPSEKTGGPGPTSSPDTLSKKIYVIGAGYVGLVTGACFAELGHRVTCVDINKDRVAALNRAEIPIFEPELEPLVRKHVDSGRLRFTTSLEGLDGGTDFVFMCVGTPAGSDEKVDLRYLRAAYTEVGRQLRGARTVIVNKSSVPPGTTEAMASILTDALKGRAHARVVANPEFLREGHAVKDFMKPNRVVVGSSDREAAEAVADLYMTFNCPVLFTTSKTAEMIKFASNAFLATKLTFVNEIAAYCELDGIDVTDVARGIGLDPRIGRDYLKAGLGYGGSCLPKDTAILRSEFRARGVEPKLLGAVMDTNTAVPARVVDRLEASLGSLRGVQVGVLGLAFKSNTDDTRHSPAITVIRELLARGANVRYFDPKARHGADTFQRAVGVATSVEDAAKGADVLLIATDWPEFKTIDLPRLKAVMRGDVLVDGRNLLLQAACVEAGFKYIGVGRGQQDAAAAPSRRRAAAVRA